MSKLMLILGILLTVVPIPIFVMSMIEPEEGPMSGIIKAIVCEPYETMIVERVGWTDYGESGENHYYYCEIEPGQQREVTGPAVLVLIAGFAGPLVAGILLITIGSMGLVRRRVSNFTNNMEDYLSTVPHVASGSSTVIDLRGNSGNIPPQTQELINSVLGGFAGTVAQATGKGSLTQRLQQLDEAYENDLISKDEYDRVRQAILDSMDD